jgi:hypothetical protein
MRKLALYPDALRVESFETGSLDGTRGTVRGHDTRITEWCNSRSCPNGCTIMEGEADFPPPPAVVAEPQELAE